MKRWLHTATVTSAAREGHFHKIAFHARPIAESIQAGQFVTADLGMLLRHPILPSAIGPEEIEALLPLDDPVATLQQGTEINLLGPVGQPFRIPAPPGRFLLVADDAHLPILIAAATRALADGCSAALLLSAAATSNQYPLELLPPALEVHLVTADGSAGHAGSLLDLLPELLRWCDQLLVAADPAQYPAMAEVVRATRLRPGPDFAQAVLQPSTVVCGVGACQGCAVPTRGGFRLACIEGPSFDLLEVEAL